MLKTLHFCAWKYKELPFPGGKYKITEKFCYFEKTLDMLNKPDWEPNLRTYYKTWER